MQWVVKGSVIKKQKSLQQTKSVRLLTASHSNLSHDGQMVAQQFFLLMFFPLFVAKHKTYGPIRIINL